MLPQEIDKAIRELGEDGEKVRGTIEREFASYLEQTAPQRKQRDLGTVSAILLSALVRPLFERYGKQLIDQLFSTDRDEFEEQLAKIRARANGEAMPADGTGAPGEIPPA